MSDPHITEVGRQVALSGMLPKTAYYLLSYLSEKSHTLHESLSPENGTGDSGLFDYCLTSACLTSPEFSDTERTRHIPYGFGDTVANNLADKYSADLAETLWQPYRPAANAATLISDWILGVSLDALEGQFQAVRAGAIQGLCREAAWVLSGLANILAAATRPGLSALEKPTCLRALDASETIELRSLVAPIRLLVWRLNVGLPTPALWLTDLRGESGERFLSRTEAIALHQVGLSSFEEIRRSSNWGRLVEMLQATGAANAHDRAKDLQQLANAWHEKIRQRARQQQIYRLDERDKEIVDELYDSREKKFEAALEAAFRRAGLAFELFDTGHKPGAFDYLLKIDGRPEVVIECKTKQGNALVDLNSARVVLGSSEQYGYGSNPCVTICHPGIDPNVSEHLQACTRLCVVETHDLAGGLVALIRKSISPESFFDWITQPGQARSETLSTFARSKLASESVLP